MNEINQQPNVSSSHAPDAVPLPPRKPWYRRPWRIFFLIVMAAIAVIAIAFVYQVFFYASAIKKGDYSVFNGEIVDVRQLATPGQVNRAQLETQDDPYWGKPDAKVVVVEFGDFGCPYCKENFPAMVKIREEYKDRIKFIFRDFPITAIHPQAMIAAEAAECAHEQNMFSPYHDYLYMHQNQYTTKDELIGYADDLGLNHDRFKSCLNSDAYQQEVYSDLADGVALGVSGTPTFFFNGQRVSGVLSEGTFRSILDSLLAKNQ